MERISKLIVKYLKRDLTPSEEAELEGWINASPANKDSFDYFINQANLKREASETFQMVDSIWEERIEKAISQKSELPGKESGKIYWFKYVSVAAMIISILVIGVYIVYVINKPSKTNVVSKLNARFKNDVAPGTDKATLTLSDGSFITLDKSTSNVTKQQGNAKLSYTNGILNYTALTSELEIAFNTIQTKRAGQYQLTLIDGSKVWLNAESSLRYPTTFSGKERIVELTGEGYFEIVKNTAMPFKVKVNDMVVTVTGTHFNINAYANEGSIRTTLLEGSVFVTYGNAKRSLIPGEQSQLENSGEINVVRGVDTEQAVAWKDGKFILRHTSLASIMREVERWYDIDVNYKQTNETKFNGTIPRNENLSELLKLLELSNEVHFEVDGRKISVLPGKGN